MHERQLPVDESTLGLLKSFLGKVSQDYASLQNEFEYLKDGKYLTHTRPSSLYNSVFTRISSYQRQHGEND